MKIKGIKRGKFIELLEEVSVEDGVEVAVEVPDATRDANEQWQQLESVIGAWKDDQQLSPE